MIEPVPTLKWTGSALRLLDQRLLPGREDFIDCCDIGTLAECIRTLAVRGAPAIGLAAAYGAVIAAETTDAEGDYFLQVNEKLNILASTRPTAVNLFYCIDIQREILNSTTDKDEAVLKLLASAERLFEDDLDASRMMGRYGADLLPDNCTILTHCNAGGLATSGLGTALAVIYEAADRGILRKVYADETRPLLQGARLTSWELSRAGIAVDVLPDSAAASLLRTGEVDAVIVGSDRIAANGDVANKIGTYPLALAANRHDVPFYVVAPLSTFDAKTPDGTGIEIEQRGRDELAFAGGKKLMPDTPGVFNPAFDITPAELVTAVICEEGVNRIRIK